ncbi:MAG: hypothetical protein KGI89_05135 [Euryarchaeota archaeon]|nr:hypothetical protein [Euryarchaeota archaeon]
MRPEVNWAAEIRAFLQQEVRRRRRRTALERIERRLAAHPTLPRGTAAALVREDRDRH